MHREWIRGALAMRTVAGCLALAGAAALAASDAGAQPQMANSYRQAAKAYRDAAQKTSCSENKACYEQMASYHDCLGNQLGPSGGSCSKPSCTPVSCPQTADGKPLYGTAMTSGATATGAAGTGGTGMSSSAPPSVQVAMSGLNTLANAWVANMQARAAADHAAFENYEQKNEWAQHQSECYEHLSAQKQRVEIQAKAARTCAVRHLVLTRMPNIDVPTACDTKAMRKLLAMAAKSVLDGDLEAALDRYTEAWLTDPTWEAVAIARALVLEGLGQADQAKDALAPFAAKLATLPAWSDEARAKAEQARAACVDHVSKLSVMGPGAAIRAGFDPSSCGGGK